MSEFTQVGFDAYTAAIKAGASPEAARKAALQAEYPPDVKYTGEQMSESAVEAMKARHAAQQAVHQALYQAAFEHVTTNRKQRRARAKLAHGAAVMEARKAAKKARRGK